MAATAGEKAKTTPEEVARLWRLPSPSGFPSAGALWKEAHPLQVYNSITRSKVPFIPMSGRRVLWYM